METIQFNSSRWIRIALINFFLVALAGVILRYKINFSLPFIDHKFLLHGHSHFAFVGWITLALMALMVNHLVKSGLLINYKKYNWLLIANTIIAYGMLFSFILQGYALFSITFSTLSIFVSYFFIYHYWKDLNKIKQDKHIVLWFKSALFLWGLSSIGTFGLAYLMISKTLIQELYFAAIYFFLHFQYNGWFVFACFGLLFSFLKESNNIRFIKISKGLFQILAITIVPTYLLSTFGLKVPDSLFWLGTVSAIIQLATLFYSYKLLQVIYSIQPNPIKKMTTLLWSLAYTSFVLKIIFQALSTVPYFSNFAFSLKPIIIGYLHLCFLGVISFFILGYFNELLNRKGIKLNKAGLLIFISGVILQEMVLMIQALDAFLNQYSGNTHIDLFISAITITTGLALLIKTKPLKKRI